MNFIQMNLKELAKERDEWRELAQASAKEAFRLRVELEAARDALETVLRENAHLADGEVCTLAPVKRALAAITRTHAPEEKP